MTCFDNLRTWTVKFDNVLNFNGVHPVVLSHINIIMCKDVKHNKLLLNSSVNAKRFGLIDHHQAIKHVI
jgi:hypothetical protein